MNRMLLVALLALNTASAWAQAQPEFSLQGIRPGTSSCESVKTFPGYSERLSDKGNLYYDWQDPAAAASFGSGITKVRVICNMEGIARVIIAESDKTKAAKTAQQTYEDLVRAGYRSAYKKSVDKLGNGEFHLDAETTRYIVVSFPDHNKIVTTLMTRPAPGTAPARPANLPAAQRSP